MIRHIAGVFFGLSLLFGAGTLPAAAPTADPLILKAIDQLKGIQSYGQRVEKRIDDAWARLEAEREAALPLLKTEMRQEILRDKADSYFLFEGCRFLAAMEDPLDKETVCAALERVDPGSKAIRQAGPKLFRLLLLLIQKGVRDERLLGAMDRHFLFADKKMKVIIPERSLNLDAAGACVFLYGACMPQGEARLARLLRKHPQQSQRILQVLSVVGTELSADAIRQSLAYGLADDPFLLGCHCLLQNGGPKGKALFLKLSLRRLGVTAKREAELLRVQAEETAYAGLRNAVIKGREGSGAGRLPDMEVKERLKKMAATRRWEKGTHPGAILDCTLTSRILIDELLKVRSHMFLRTDSDTLFDVARMNMLLNALRYRMAEWKEMDR